MIEYELHCNRFNPIPVLFTNEELSDHIHSIISGKESGDEISFQNICLSVIRLAENEGKIKSNTEYHSSEISTTDQERISAILWDLILDRKIYILFGNKRWFACNQDDTLFGSYYFLKLDFTRICLKVL